MYLIISNTLLSQSLKIKTVMSEIKKWERGVIWCDSACNKDTVADASASASAGGDRCEAWASVIGFSDEKCETPIDLLRMTSAQKDLPMRDVVTPLHSSESKLRIIVAKTTDVVSQHNNYGELLALLVSLRIALSGEMGRITVIYSDSDTVLKWWSTGHYKSVKDQTKIKYILECTELRKKFELTGGTIVKVDGKKNKADLGWHR